MALVFNSSMQYEEDEGDDGCFQEAEENNIVELSRIIPYLCSNTMNPVWQVCMMLSPFLPSSISGLRTKKDTLIHCSLIIMMTTSMIFMI